jgi:cob(I)alamin adenosyltransferase
MKIYTKTGDKGKTSLFGGLRVSKDALRIEAYGTVDELNSHLGAIRSLKPGNEIDQVLEKMQNDLFTLGADLATPSRKKGATVQRIEAHHVEQAEKTIDHLDSNLEPLQNFILPGGSRIAAQIHIARTVCRRAERCVVQLARKESIGAIPIIYLNRLSDLLFVLARYANKREGTAETKWRLEGRV